MMMCCASSMMMCCASSIWSRAVAPPSPPSTVHSHRVRSSRPHSCEDPIAFNTAFTAAVRSWFDADDLIAAIRDELRAIGGADGVAAARKRHARDVMVNSVSERKRVLRLCEKHGLRVLIDLHGARGARATARHPPPHCAKKND